MSKIGFDLGFPPEPALRTPDTRLVLPYCLVGLEFEFERVTRGLPNAPWALYWQSKRDNSLHDAGVEFVFRRPYFGADVIAAVEGLCAFARENRFNVSIRTGLHVHIDVRDMEQAHFNNMCALYALFERALYRYIGDNRDENVFCLPWYKAHGTVMKINGIVGSSREGLRAQAGLLRDEKYAGLNLDPLARFGSAEFRHALTTTDVGRVLDWVNILLRLKQASTELGYNADQYVRMLRDPRWFGRQVFQQQFDLLDYDGFDSELVEEGIPIMLDVMKSPGQGWGALKLKATSDGGCFSKWAKGAAKPTTPPREKKSALKRPRLQQPAPPREETEFDRVIRGMRERVYLGNTTTTTETVRVAPGFVRVDLGVPDTWDATSSNDTTRGNE